MTLGAAGPVHRVLKSARPQVRTSSTSSSSASSWNHGSIAPARARVGGRLLRHDALWTRQRHAAGPSAAPPPKPYRRFSKLIPRLDSPEQAKAMGDVLIVGVHSDAEITRNKGPTVMNNSER